MRTYLPADARCRQLERLVHQHPGASVSELLAMVNIAWASVQAYMRRLAREKRVVAVPEDAALKRGTTFRYYPPGHASLKKVA